MSPSTLDRSLEALADTLASERHTIELLLYKLSVTRLTLQHQEHTFAPFVLDEVESVLGLVRAAETQRAQALVAVASVWPDNHEITLSRLAKEAEEPLRSIFEDHLHAFEELIGQVEATAAVSRDLAQDSLNGIEGELDDLWAAFPSGASNAGAPSESSDGAQQSADHPVP